MLCEDDCDSEALDNLFANDSVGSLHVANAANVQQQGGAPLGCHCYVADLSPLWTE